MQKLIITSNKKNKHENTVAFEALLQTIVSNSKKKDTIKFILN